MNEEQKNNITEKILKPASGGLMLILLLCALLITIGGMVGGVLTGIFCVPELSWTDFGGLLYTGDVSLLCSQIAGIAITIVFVGILDVVLAFIVKACFKGSLRVSEEKEAQGLDIAAHGESAYPAYIGLD